MNAIIQIKHEKKMFEGKITYEEGDIVEASFPERIGITVGEPVNCMVTKNYKEMHHFMGVVIAKDETRLCIFHSPTIAEYKEQRRVYPRFDVNANGWIRIVDSKTKQQAGMYPQVVLVNVSLGGVAFRYKEKIQPKTQIAMSTELYGQDVEEGIINCHIEVVHIKEEDIGFVHGCKITSLSGKYLHKLRKFLLQRQLEQFKAGIKD